MSLKVWLPLNGNLKNQGVSNSVITNNNATVSDSGKIGSCYSFNGSNAYLSGTDAPLSNDTKDWSFCCWVKFNDLVNPQCIFSNRTKSANTGITIFWFSENQIYFDDGLRWSFVPTITLNTDIWYHLAFVRQTGVGKKFYVNGVLSDSDSTIGTPTTATSSTFTIGAHQNSSEGGVGSGNRLNGYLNDVRVYDHALSAKEVKEISKALIVHYPLDRNGKGNDNLVTGSNTASIDTNYLRFVEQVGGTTRTIEYDGGIPCIKITRDSTEHSGYDYLCYMNLKRNLLKTSTTYTISFDAIASGSGTIGFSNFKQTNSSNELCSARETIQNSFNSESWSHIVFRTTTKDSFDGITVGSQVVYMECSYLDNTDVWLMVKNFKVEEGSVDTGWCPAPEDDAYTIFSINDTTEYDTSGYEHHGTIVSTLPDIDSDSPKYGCCYKYSGNKNNVHYNNTTDLNFTDNFSWSIWIKTNFTGTTKQYAFTVGRGDDNGGRGYGLRCFSDSACRVNYGSASWTVNVAGGVWTHIAFTKSGDTCKIYKNGVLDSTQTFSGTTPTYSDGNGVGIGCFYYTNIVYPYYGSISDFRIYATALSDDDIRELYNTSASIADNGSIMCLDFKEY